MGSKRRIRSPFTLRLTDEEVKLLGRVAWDNQLALDVEHKLQKKRLRFALGRVWTVVVLVLFSTLGVAIYSPGTSGLIALAAFLSALSLLVLHVEHIDADLVMINRLIQVFRASQQSIESVEDRQGRQQLASVIMSASSQLMMYGQPLSWSVHRRSTNREAAACRRALRRYAALTVTADADDLLRLREDFARAFLRVASGRWFEIQYLNAGVDDVRKGHYWRTFLTDRTTLKEVAALVAVLVSGGLTIAKVMGWL